MIPIPSSARLARGLVILAAAFATATAVRAQSDVVELDRVVTTATRTPSAPFTVGSAVDAISAQELAAQQLDGVSAALGGTGAALFRSGGAGSSASLFLRGANSNQTLFLIDGIRASDANTDYQMLLGGLTLAPGDRIEIARGPQSTLYGAEAVGGVVSIHSTRGRGAPTARVIAEGGSFGSIGGGIACQGERGANAWNFSAGAGHTDNDRRNNAFDSANAALRLDRRVNANVGIGATLRGYRGKLESPSDRYIDDPNDTETESNLLGTTFLEAKFAADWNARVTLGGQHRRYVAETPAPNAFGSPAGETIITNRRGVLDAQATYTGIERNRLTVGANGELLRTRNTGFGDIDERQRLHAFFAQDEITLGDSWFVTAGLRRDDFDTFGAETTGRGTVAWLVVPKTLKLRASYGTGFRSPSFLDLYGRSLPFYLGSELFRQQFPGAPALRPERSRGYDAGVDYYLPGQRGVISLTAFQTDTDDLITYQFAPYPTPSTVVNVGKARSRGLEASAKASLFGGYVGSLSYTYLDAVDLSSAPRTRLLRRPRHVAAADLHREFAGGFSAGAGVRVVAGRRDVHAFTFEQINAEDFTVVRVYAGWRATERLLLTARLENLLNERYEEVHGYPTRGFGAFARAELSF